MKITLVHSKYFNSWEALGLGYIGAYLKANLDADINYYQGCFDDIGTVVHGAASSDIVAFSATTPTFPYAVNLASRIKMSNPKVKIVVGGYHVSAVGSLAINKFVDYAVIGEGEHAMLDICKGTAHPGILYGAPMDFSVLPWPDRELIKNERNIQVAYKDNNKRITSFQSHRGCPFSCKFCADGHNKVLYKDFKNAMPRYRPVDDLLDEMQAVTESYNLDLMKFSDPTWNTNLEWVYEFCEKKIKRGFKTPFYPNIHAGVCNEKMIALMAEANCYEVAVGVESGSPKILKQIGKGTNLNTIRKCISLIKKSGILVRGYFLLGMPEEDEEDVKLTEMFAEELELDEYGFSILCPYPGTEQFNAETMSKVDWEKADEYSNDFWRTKHLSNARLKELQKKLTDKFKHRLTWHNKATLAREQDG